MYGIQRVTKDITILTKEEVILKQKVKDKIEELEKKMGYEQNEKSLIHLHKQRKILKELLEE